MTEPTFDHERLDVYRLSIDNVACALAKTLAGSNRHACDQWLHAAQSIPLNIAKGNGKQSLKDKIRFFEIARGSALEYASIHDVLRVFDAIDNESNLRGKSDLKRISFDAHSVNPADGNHCGGSNRVRVRVPRC